MNQYGYLASMLLSAVTFGILLAAGVMARKRLGGKGGNLLILGGGCGLLSVVILLAFILTTYVGVGVVDHLDPTQLMAFLQGLSMVQNVSLVVAAMGVVRVVLLFGAMIERSETLREIRAEQR
jgi:hypothetical protein